jgi:undecaprenyl pyrophosphate phosphatase UppP
VADERAFFQIAAALIPVLLLGGILLERARPPKDDAPLSSFQRVVALSLPFLGLWVVFAEVVSIQVALTGDPTDFDRIAVISTLVLGSALIAAVIALPWLERLRRQAPNYAIAIYGVALVLAIGILAASIDRLDQGIRAAEQTRQIREFETLVKEYLRLDRREGTPSEVLIVLLKQMSAVLEEINRDE